MTERKPDHFYRKAKESGLAARSIFKLEELDQKYRLFGKKDVVLDLGSAPGSWLQYIADRVGEKGKIVGVDQKPLKISLPSYVQFFQADIFEMDFAVLKKFAPQYDSVMSDMAPRTSGDKDGDHFRSMELCQRAFELACGLLKPNGTFVCKTFQGKESEALLKSIKKSFKIVKTQKPKASRFESRENYILALHFRGRAPRP